MPEQAYFDDFKVTSGGRVLLEEDFSKKARLFAGGEVVDGRFYVSGPAAYCWQQKVAKAVRYDVEVDMTLINDNASICFSATAADRYMMWAINTLDVAQPVVRRHVYASSGTPRYSDTAIPFTKDEVINHPHHIRIECETPEVRTYVDDKLVDTYSDVDGVLAVGDLGFRVSATGNEREKAYFDNLRMTVYNDDGTKTVTVNEDFEKNTTIFDNATVKDYNGSRQIYMEAPAGSAVRTMQSEGSVLPGIPMMRHTFTLDKEVASARLYSSALGVYNIYVNGTRVYAIDDDGKQIQDELKPGSTELHKTVFYCTHDVTRLVQQGKNAIGAEVSSGWFNGAVAHGMYGSGANAFRGMLVVRYTDGSTQTICTDTSWRSNANGPIRKGDIFNGETYDARLESDWTKPDFDDSQWYATAVSNDFKGKLVAFEGPSVQAVPAYARHPQTIYVYEGTTATGTAYGMLNEVAKYSGEPAITLKAGQTAIYDLGQNAAGWVSFRVKGNAGTRLRFRFSEMRNETGDTNRGDDGPGGSLYLINLRSAQASLFYTLRGDAEGEAFHPTTTFFGFRFIEVTASEDVELSDVVGETVTSAMTERSSMKTSHETVNQLYSNIIWGQRSNFLSIPTDCPQRDERQGWTADTQVFSMAGLYNADTRNFYAKWMRDMRDAQRGDGAYPVIAPYMWDVGYGAAAWADAGIIVPWNVYLMTGDTQIIKDNFESMESYMNWLSQQSGDGYKYQGGYTTYGDWVAFVDTDRRYCSVAYYAYVADLMARMCKALSQAPGDTYDEKAIKYGELFENIK
ncbi:MAG: family 78 glycoside hydrolase catalytic domain, partial [Bacteroidaceae bacterium]|nr:family 78 glycoside hydrolase catalytic domain [Bacteroidaceae bacterium]